ncbi:MAG: FAD-dependent oxidoreductase, partial [Burkholderiaceae bacterium]|nr:FAD-dependent oxidoreductase [Burkholderiaceae bacterium]
APSDRAARACRPPPTRRRRARHLRAARAAPTIGFFASAPRLSPPRPCENRLAHALFMRTFSGDVTLFERDCVLDENERRLLAEAGVRYIGSPLLGITLDEGMAPLLHTKDGESHRADVAYPMLGETACSALALALGLGAACDPCGKLLVDEHQRTSVPGLFAAGDVAVGLNQISVAAGQAAVAATAIHNSLPPRYRGLAG